MVDIVLIGPTDVEHLLSIIISNCEISNDFPGYSNSSYGCIAWRSRQNCNLTAWRKGRHKLPRSRKPFFIDA
jgi:hypothetical protein